MKVDYECQTAQGLFRDSLNVPDGTSQEDIEKMKAERINSRREFIENPPEGSAFPTEFSDG